MVFDQLGQEPVQFPLKLIDSLSVLWQRLGRKVMQLISKVVNSTLPQLIGFTPGLRR